MGSKVGSGGGIDMKKLYDVLKYIIYGSLYVIVFKTGFDFYNYKKYPNVYAYYSAPWYTGALLYGIVSLAVIIVCIIGRKIIFKKLMGDTRQGKQ